MKIKLFLFLGVILGLPLFLLNFKFTEAAFGISPPAFRAEHAVKGSTYSQIIYLVQDQPNDDLRIEANLRIDEKIKDWFVINDGKEIIIPKGVRQFPLKVTLNVPKNADLGVYDGSLTFMGVPDQAGQVTIALGAEATIGVTVGTGIFRKFSVPLVEFLDIEEGWSPRVKVKFNNEGNVAETLDGATYELFDKFGAVRLAYIQKDDDFPEVPPFTIQDYTLEFPIDLHLGIGDYWGSVNLIKGEKVIATQRTVFKVLEAGSLTPGFFKLIFNHIKLNQQYYGGAILLALVIFLIYSRKPRKFFLKKLFRLG